MTDPLSSKKYLTKVLVLACFLLAGILIYGNTLDVPFVFDDTHHIVSNPDIRLTEITLAGMKRAWAGSALSNRPVAYLSFSANYYLGQYDVQGYHLFNIFIHLSTGLLLYLLFSATLAIKTSASKKIEPSALVPFFAALIWLVHPIHTQSVTYIIQRMNSLSALFYILCMLLYIKGRQMQRGNTSDSQTVHGRHLDPALVRGKAAPTIIPYGLFAASLFAGLLAIGSKEIAATLPFSIFLYEWYFFQDLSVTWLRRHLFLFGLMLLILALIALVYLGENPINRILWLYQKRDFTMAQRVLTEFRVVIFYISLLFFPNPSRLNLEHDFPISFSLIDPFTTLLSLLLILLLLAASIVLAKKERILSFCIIWFFVNLAIESSVIGLELVFEHRLYLPSMFVMLSVILLCTRYIKPAWLNRILLCLAVVILSVWTFDRNKVWKNEITLLKDCVKKSPDKARPLYNLGVALAEKGETIEAVRYYRAALDMKPDNAAIHTNLAIELFGQGKTDDAIHHYNEALRINPKFVNAHINLGKTLAATGHLTEAMAHFRTALDIHPDSAPAHYYMGNGFLQQNALPEAIKHYSRALKINPNYAEAANNLGVALVKIGETRKAAALFQAALAMKPDFKDAKRNLDNIKEKH